MTLSSSNARLDATSGGSAACICRRGHHGEMEAMARSESFEEFYIGAVGRLIGQLFPVTGDLHEAEEVVQEA